MKCEICGKSPADGVTTLFRQNPLGEVGIWRCEQDNRVAADPEVAQVVAELQHIRDKRIDA